MNREELIEQTGKGEMMSFFGVKVVEATAEKVVLTMTVTPRAHQYVGIMHGGVSLLLAETAGSIGAVLATDLTKQTPVGIEINANHLRAVSEGVVTVTAVPVYHGRTLSVWHIELKNDADKIICISRFTAALKTGGIQTDKP